MIQQHKIKKKIYQSSKSNYEADVADYLGHLENRHD